MPPAKGNRQKKSERSSGGRFLGRSESAQHPQTYSDDAQLSLTSAPLISDEEHNSSSCDSQGYDTKSSASEWTDTSAEDSPNENPLTRLVETRIERRKRERAAWEEARRKAEIRRFERELGGVEDKTGIKRGQYKVGGLSERTIRERKASMKQEAKENGLPAEELEKELRKLDKLAKPKDSVALARFRQTSLTAFFGNFSATAHRPLDVPKRPAEAITVSSDSDIEMNSPDSNIPIQSAQQRAMKSQDRRPTSQKRRRVQGAPSPEPSLARSERDRLEKEVEDRGSGQQSESAIRLNPDPEVDDLEQTSDSSADGDIWIEMGGIIEGEQVAEGAAEWADVVGEEVVSDKPTFKRLEALAEEGLASARKRKVYGDEVLFAALCDFYAWSDRQGRIRASLRVARNHRRGPAFAKVIRAQARYFEQSGSLRPSARGKRAGARSLLDDEELTLGVQRYLRTLGTGKVRPPS